ncbi:MAG: TonB-dependent hemoglobin/transferrin/lactoferrin family receptor [Holophagales bacterium]|nr:TonB-dependent hemoglobin/transferrin/lactoferrin family receptor [Holophagales bacterium]
MRHSALLAAIIMLPAYGLRADEDPPRENQKKEDPPKETQKKRELPSATVIVSATKTALAEKEVTTTVSVKTEKELDQKLVSNILDLTRFEPGVDVSAQPDRQGATSFSIRGIGGNRVLILVDGVNLPDGPEAGRNYSRDFVDLDSLKRVEILRGPSSALYGSDAIGGVVTYMTKDAKDYLEGKSGAYSSLKAAYASAYEGVSSTLTVAGVRGKWDALLLGTVRAGHEIKPAAGATSPYIETNGEKTLNRAYPNQMTYRSNNVMGKIGYSPNESHNLNLSVQYFERQNDTTLFSTLGRSTFSREPIPNPPPGMPPGILRSYYSKVTESYGDDASRRSQINFGYIFDSDDAFFQHIDWRVFYNKGRSLERTTDHHEPSDDANTISSSLIIRETNYGFQQEIWGTRAHGEKRFNSNGWVHKLLFGHEFTQSKTSRPYDRTDFDQDTGEQNKVVAGIKYPSKVMPDSTTTTVGYFIQGEVFSPTLAWSFIAGLRFDNYNLVPRPDQEFANSNTSDLHANSISNSAVSPKFGIIRTINPDWSVYGQYASGFRNPPYDNVNIAMFIPNAGPAGVRIIPNSDLGPERCHSFEVGLHGGDQTNWNLSAAVFYSRYNDFITDVRLPDDAGEPMVFRYQFQNLEKVQIYGAEIKAGVTFFNNFVAQLSLAYAKGENLDVKIEREVDGETIEERIDEPLDSIAPLKGVLGLGYQRNNWGVEAIYTMVAKKTGIPNYDFNDANSTPFQAPGFGALDLMGHFSFGSKGNWRIQVGVFNVLDKTYWKWEDVRGYTLGHSDLPRYTQPGRNFSASVIFSWK